MITKLNYGEKPSECPIKFIDETEFDNIKDKIIVVLRPETCELYIVTCRGRNPNNYVYTLTKLYNGMNRNMDCNIYCVEPKDLLDNNEYKVYMLDRLLQLKDIPEIEYYV